MARGYPDFEGGKDKLYTAAEWGVREGDDIHIRNVAANVATGDSVEVSRLVGAGKRLYVNQIAFICVATLAANRDNNQMCVYQLMIDAGTHFYVGGNGGGGWSLPAAIVVKAGQTLRVLCFNYANHNCDLAVYAGGYEIDE